MNKTLVNPNQTIWGALARRSHEGAGSSDGSLSTNEPADSSRPGSSLVHVADKQKGGAPLDRVPLRRRHYHRRGLGLDRVALGPTHPSAITPSLGLPHRELLPPVCTFAICLCLACPRLTPAGAGMHPLTEPADSRVLPPLLVLDCASVDLLL